MMTWSLGKVRMVLVWIISWGRGVSSFEDLGDSRSVAVVWHRPDTMCQFANRGVQVFKETITPAFLEEDALLG